MQEHLYLCQSLRKPNCSFTAVLEWVFVLPFKFFSALLTLCHRLSVCPHHKAFRQLKLVFLKIVETVFSPVEIIILKINHVSFVDFDVEATSKHVPYILFLGFVYGFIWLKNNRNSWNDSSDLTLLWLWKDAIFCSCNLLLLFFWLQLDSWSVILNGSVEVTYPEGRTEILCMGNSFGVSPTMEKEYMKGVMKTKVDDCQVGSSRLWTLITFWVSFLIFFF